ncbi:exported hypothetical protein [Rhodococcus ruber]|uniref:Uncharacterized protein n=1 Tax=Rhodococcus ruber TaxID=1830 RepID=A0A098BLP2_9NOCA|nr:exported hypothetical protein [Rhodococcus ruber]
MRGVRRIRPRCRRGSSASRSDPAVAHASSGARARRRRRPPAGRPWNRGGYGRRGARRCRDRLSSVLRSDQVDEAVGAQPDALGVRDDLSDGGMNGGIAGFGAIGDDRTASATQLHQAFVAQLLIAPQHGVDVEAERGGQVACTGEALARPDLAAGHRAAHGRSQLHEQRVRRVRIQSDEHDTSILFYLR